MNKSRQFFGTDGIRGKTGEGNMTPEFALELGIAAGTVFNGKSKIFIARDSRLSGEMLQAAFVSGVCSTGMSVCDLGVLPTPACAYLTKLLSAEAGVVISASHNPYYDNGFKFFNNQGCKLSDENEFSIENVIFTNRENGHHICPNRIGHYSIDHSLSKHYVDYCLDVVKKNNKQKVLDNFKNLRVVLDCSNGATYQTAPEVFSELGVDLVVLNNEPNGLNINQQCGAADSLGLEILGKKIKTHKADFGIAFDGDGDRVILVSKKGEIVDGDQVLYILANDLLNNNQNIPGVVGTQMTNLGLEHALRNKGVDFARSKVGDRYVLEQLREKEWTLGGEASGHILNLDCMTTGDGLVTALLVISAVARAEKTLDQLLQGYTKYPQIMVNVTLQQEYSNILENPIVTQAITDVTKRLNDKGRLVVRKSGTEPLLRIMVEGENSREIKSLANKLSDCITAEMK